MDWRRRRQFTIFIIVILIAGLWGFRIFQNARPIATCFDNRQNQNEEGIDCGGSCIPCKLLEVQDVEVLWTKVLEARPGSFDALASIKNPNVYFGTLAMRYEFELLDENGASIALRQGSTFLLPLENVTLVEPDIRSTLTARQALFKIRSIEWGRVYEPAPKYDVGLGKRDYEVVTNPQGIRQSVVRTSVFNNSGERFSQVFVAIFLTDAEKNIIAANRTIVENVAPGETRPIQFVWPQEITGSISGIEGEVRVNSFIR